MTELAVLARILSDLTLHFFLPVRKQSLNYRSGAAWNMKPNTFYRTLLYVKMISKNSKYGAKSYLKKNNVNV